MDKHLVDKRVGLYNRFIKEDEQLNIDYVMEIYELIKMDEGVPWKYNLPFIRKCSKFIINEEKDNYQLVVELYELISNDKMIQLIDYNKEYDDFDMYAINNLKALQNIPESLDKAKEVYSFYIEHTSKNILKDAYFYSSYNYIKNYKSSEKFENVKDLFLELIKYKKDSYIMMIPIRLYFMNLSSLGLSFILSILKGKVNLYDLNRIIKYLRKYDSKFNDLQFIKLEEDNNEFNEKKRVNDFIIEYCMDHIDSIDNIFIGKLNRKLNSDFGFIIYNNTRVFTYLKKLRYKNNTNVLFAVYDSYDKTKSMDSKQGIIIKEIK
ncbi:hypothetical protein [Mariniplasma anaerobium]|uniref:Uncharacterized protein n=1 Tax=Mariniplasma anaerobium TaxID=2735436 RepID=A0A7U9TLY3_9MOLU|nr:hypothetical protein [Mariniplasma anaerobium]BCR35551.1 hypothetical protein MPAN_004440 [Mariniplasma anaerobium]